MWIDKNTKVGSNNVKYKMKFLIAEDDKYTSDFLGKSLKSSGHTCDIVDNGKDALFLAVSENYDALILDRMIPDIDGLSLVKTLRSMQKTTPVLLLTAMADTEDRVEGLEAGADDYLVKPFAFSELLARLAAITRRGTISNTQTVLQVGDLKMDLIKHVVTRDGRKLDLQPQEFKLLEYLIRSEGRIVTRTMLLEDIWDFHFDPKTTVVETHISRLRAKIDKGFKKELLNTVRGVGYYLRDE